MFTETVGGETVTLAIASLGSGPVPPPPPPSPHAANSTNAETNRARQRLERIDLLQVTDGLWAPQFRGVRERLVEASNGT